MRIYSSQTSSQQLLPSLISNTTLEPYFPTAPLRPVAPKLSVSYSWAAPRVGAPHSAGCLLVLVVNMSTAPLPPILIFCLVFLSSLTLSSAASCGSVASVTGCFTSNGYILSAQPVACHTTDSLLISGSNLTANSICLRRLDSPSTYCLPLQCTTTLGNIRLTCAVPSFANASAGIPVQAQCADGVSTLTRNSSMSATDLVVYGDLQFSSAVGLNCDLLAGGQGGCGLDDQLILTATSPIYLLSFGYPWVGVSQYINAVTWYLSSTGAPRAVSSSCTGYSADGMQVICQFPLLSSYLNRDTLLSANVSLTSSYRPFTFSAVVATKPPVITGTSGCVGQPFNNTWRSTAGCFTGQTLWIYSQGFVDCASSHSAVQFVSTVQPGRVYSLAVDGKNCSGTGTPIGCKVPEVDAVDRNQPLLVAGVDCNGHQGALYPSVPNTYNGEVQPLSALTTNGPLHLTGISGVNGCTLDGSSRTTACSSLTTYSPAFNITWQAAPLPVGYSVWQYYNGAAILTPSNWLSSTTPPSWQNGWFNTTVGGAIVGLPNVPASARPGWADVSLNYQGAISNTLTQAVYLSPAPAVVTQIKGCGWAGPTSAVNLLWEAAGCHTGDALYLSGANLLVYNLGLYSNVTGNIYPFTSCINATADYYVSPVVMCTIPAVAAVDVNGNFSVWDIDVRTAVRSAANKFSRDVQHFGDLALTSAAVGYARTASSVACVMGATDSTGCSAGSPILLTSSTILFPPNAYSTYYYSSQLSLFNPATGAVVGTATCNRIYPGDDRSAWCTLPTVVSSNDRDRWLSITFTMNAASVNRTAAVYVTTLAPVITYLSGCLANPSFTASGAGSSFSVATGCYTGMPFYVYASSSYLPNTSLALVSTVQPGRRYALVNASPFTILSTEWPTAMPLIDAADVNQPLLIQAMSPNGLASLFPPASNQPTPSAVLGAGNLIIASVTGYNCNVSSTYNASTTCMGRGLMITLSRQLPSSWTQGLLINRYTMWVVGTYSPCALTFTMAGSDSGLQQLVVYNSTTLIVTLPAAPLWPQDVYRGKWLDVTLQTSLVSSNSVSAAWIWPTANGSLSSACPAPSSSSSSSSSSTATISLSRRSSSSSSSSSAATSVSSSQYSSTSSSSSSSLTLSNTASSELPTGPVAPVDGGPNKSSSSSVNIGLIVGVVVGGIVLAVVVLVLLLCCGCASCCCVGWTCCAAVSATRGMSADGVLAGKSGVVAQSDASQQAAADVELSIVPNSTDEGRVWHARSTSD